MKRISIISILLISLANLSHTSQRDKIFLMDGQILTGRLVNRTIQFNTIYGNFDVPTSAARKIERVDEKLEILHTVNDERISGHIANDVLELQVTGGPKIKVRKELIKKIVFAPRDKIKLTSKDYFMMKNEDVFYGEVLDTSFVFVSRGGEKLYPG